jgi:tryptophan-rich sensory protein
MFPATREFAKKRKNNYMSEAYNWYSQLKKPSWSPPSWLFGPVWTVLYVLIAVSFGAVFVMAGRNQIAWIVALPFVLNLIFNFAFTYIQFGLKNNFLAALDILLTLGTLIWAIIVIFPYASWITYIQIPYLLWVSFATTLQLTITNLNKKS